MKKKIIILLIGIVFLCRFGLAEDFKVSFLPVDQIEVGMKGKGKTFLQDGKFEEFEVEILGILYNWQPNRNLILAKLQSDVLERTGVIPGMSGIRISVLAGRSRAALSRICRFETPVHRRCSASSMSFRS